MIPEKHPEAQSALITQQQYEIANLRVAFMMEPKLLVAIITQAKSCAHIENVRAKKPSGKPYKGCLNSLSYPIGLTDPWTLI